MEQNVSYGFGAFLLETNTQLLRYENGHIRLQPKTYRLLLYFLQHPGRLISRDELFDNVWHGRFVEDTALRLAVNALRKVLHDESRTPRYILTICRRGYRFLPEVTIKQILQEAVQPDPQDSSPYQSKLQLPDAEWHFDFALEQLLGAFAQAADGNRYLVFLSGARGAGKTALLERFLGEVRHSNPTTLRSRCVQLAGSTEPFLPLLEALERRYLQPGGQSLIDSLQQIAPTWLYQMANRLEPAQLASLHLRVPQFNSGQMLREGADFFEKLGTESIFILILDNSHWTDDFTLDLINFLALRCSPTKLLMILSFRPDENCPGFRRIKLIREELVYRGVCQVLSLGKSL
jgi:DNA-binding winged helix-turn-helix (wHTH) protein